jgi:hypothetical protein
MTAWNRVRKTGFTTETKRRILHPPKGLRHPGIRKPMFQTGHRKSPLAPLYQRGVKQKQGNFPLYKGGREGDFGVLGGEYEE